MGEYKVDLGASWIHGVGPGCGDLEDWKDQENPIYTIAKDNGIETVKTWENYVDTTDYYYWFKGKDEGLDISGIGDKLV